MIAPRSRLVGRSSDVTGNSRSDRQPVRKDRGNDSKWRQEPWLNATFVDGAKLISGIASLALATVRFCLMRNIWASITASLSDFTSTTMFSVIWPDGG